MNYNSQFNYILVFKLIYLITLHIYILFKRLIYYYLQVIYLLVISFIQNIIQHEKCVSITLFN